MIRKFIYFLGVVSFVSFSLIDANLEQLDHKPCNQAANLFTTQSLINSADFHPFKNELSVTFTHSDKVVIYELDENGKIVVKQVLSNLKSKKNHPAFAAYSKDGKSLFVANWTSQCFDIYLLNEQGLFDEIPYRTLRFFSKSTNYRPHGIAFSPNGQYLAVSFGAATHHPKAIGLYKVKNLGTPRLSLEQKQLLTSKEISKGIPKGVTFSPDGSCIIVTFAHTNSFAVYRGDLSKGKISSKPKQIIKGNSSQVSRPEDVKFSVDGAYAAVSNSDKDTVTFYPFDHAINVFTQNTPSYTLKNPSSELYFPHGLAFSPDGKFLVITQFGNVEFSKEGELRSWGSEQKEGVSVFRLSQSENSNF